MVKVSSRLGLENGENHASKDETPSNESPLQDAIAACVAATNYWSLFWCGVSDARSSSLSSFRSRRRACRLQPAQRAPDQKHACAKILNLEAPSYVAKSDGAGQVQRRCRWARTPASTLLCRTCKTAQISIEVKTKYQTRTLSNPTLRA